MSNRERILELLLNSRDHSISCARLADFGLYHKAASRCGELRKQGYDIRFIAGETWDQGRYILIEESKFKEESNGQFSFASKL